MHTVHDMYSAVVEYHHTERGVLLRLSIALTTHERSPTLSGSLSPRSLYWLPGSVPCQPCIALTLLAGCGAFLLLCMRTRSVCTGVALPFLVPRTPQVLIPLMAALMILGIKMLAIGVMTHNHDLGIKDAGHHVALVLSTDYVLLQHMHCTCSHCACSVWVHTPRPSSNGCTHDPWDHDAGHRCNDPRP